MSQQYDIVFTSGGIGATHDDVTLRAVAIALNQELRLNNEMLRYLQEINVGGVARATGTNSSSSSNNSSRSDLAADPLLHAHRHGLDESLRRLAVLPQDTRLRFAPAPDDHLPHVQPTTTAHEAGTSGTSGMSEQPAELTKTWPILQCDNIFILPGVPQFYAEKMHLIVKHFLPKNKKPIVRKIVLDLEEKNLVAILDQLVARHSEVKFGSYPFVDHPEFKTIITLTGGERRKVELAVAALLQTLPVNAVLRVEKGAAAQQAVCQK